jgi:hypothetical protein
VAQLIHQISAELKRNSESAADYQDLVIELEALNRALKQLQAIKTTQHNVNLEAVRALPVTCRNRLETFLEKISKFEKSLGPWKPHHGQFRGFGRRLQWSTAYKDDIAALRAKLAPKSATITVLLLTQTIDSIAKAESDRDSIAREVAGKIFGQQMLMADAVDKINSLSITQQDLKAGQARLGLQLRGHRHELSTLKLKADALLRHSTRHERLITRQDNTLEQIRADVSVLKIQTCAMFTATVNPQQDLHEIKSSTQTILGRTLDILVLVTAGVSQINHVLGSVSKLRMS